MLHVVPLGGILILSAFGSLILSGVHHLASLTHSIIVVLRLPWSPVTLISIVTLFSLANSFFFRLKQNHLPTLEKVDENILLFVSCNFYSSRLILIQQQNHNRALDINKSHVCHSTYIRTDFVHSMRQFMPRIFVSRAKAFVTEWQFATLFAFEADANDWRLLTIHALNFVNDILRFLYSMDKGQNICVAWKLDVLLQPQANELIFTQTNHSETL